MCFRQGLLQLHQRGLLSLVHRYFLMLLDLQRDRRLLRVELARHLQKATLASIRHRLVPIHQRRHQTVTHSRQEELQTGLRQLYCQNAIASTVPLKKLLEQVLRISSGCSYVMMGRIMDQQNLLMIKLMCPLTSPYYPMA